MIRRLAKRLRYLADRLDPDGAPRGTSLSFVFRNGVGIVINQDGYGGPLYTLRDHPDILWYLGKADYERAHDE